MKQIFAIFSRLVPRLSVARLLRATLAWVLMVVIASQAVMAQAILRDAETESLLQDIARPIVAAAGLQPNNVQIILIGDKEINAFVAGGQAVYLHSGLLEAADSVNEVQGVIAHELGHITGGHIIRSGEGAQAATGITILSLLLGAAAIAAGAGDAGMGVMMAGQQAALGKYLAFTRIQEGSADAAGIGYLRGAGLSGRGMLSFFQKIRKEEFRYASTYAEVDPFMQTHPMSADREAALQNDVLTSPSYGVPTDPALEARFQRVKAKLIGYMDDPQTALRKFPESNRSLEASYARAYAWHRGAYPDKAAAEVERLVSLKPHDPYILELKGQILLESGKPKEALVPLREAVERSHNAPLIAALFGHALIATEDNQHLDEARRTLKVAVSRDRDNPFAWYTLGVVYDRQGDEPRARLATAERYALLGNSQMAAASAEAAMQGLPQGSPDYIRAEDIALSARSAAKDRKGRGR